MPPIKSVKPAVAEPWWSTVDGCTVKVWQGDVFQVLKKLPSKSVQCTITSPPYWQLRDYQTGTWTGGQPECDHDAGKKEVRTRETYNDEGNYTSAFVDKVERGMDHIGNKCLKCGAKRTDHQLGSEKLHDCLGWAKGANCAEQDWQSACHVCRMTLVFREVRRLLRDDGVLFLNYGDSYVGETRSSQVPPQIQSESDRRWLAAVIDCEGSISGTKHIRKDDGSTRTSISVHVTNTDTRLLRECDRIFPLSKTELDVHGDGHYGRRPCFRWSPDGNNYSATLLQEVWPYLIVKQKQATLAWHLLEMSKTAQGMGKTEQGKSDKEKREWIVGALSRLNHAEDINLPDWAYPPPYVPLAGVRLKSGNMSGIPWRVALALQADGWILRSDIPWVKRSAMPESVSNRPAKALEYVFMLVKKMGYFYDGEAIKPDTVTTDMGMGSRDRVAESNPNEGSRWKFDHVPAVRNFRNADLWYQSTSKPHGLVGVGDELVGLDVTSEGYAGAHFACFPQKLVEPFVLARTSEHGACATCGSPWVRITKVERSASRVSGGGNCIGKQGHKDGKAEQQGNYQQITGVETVGWRPSCECHGKLVKVKAEKMVYGDWNTKDEDDPLVHWKPSTDREGTYAKPKKKMVAQDVYESDLPLDQHPVRPCVVLDPFLGSGTTVSVALQHGRHGWGIELSEKYLTDNALPRIREQLQKRVECVADLGINQSNLFNGEE